MHALLGRITNIVALPEGGDGRHRLEISFKPVCILPARTKLPEWLKDQVLKVQREVVDVREIGNPGDSIVLTAEESAPWLYPLTITPNIAYGALPPAITVHLRWWKDENPPEYLVKANGRQIGGKFTKQEHGFSAELPTALFYDAPPLLPVEFEVTCEKMRIVCSVLPQNVAFARKLTLPEHELMHVENGWYAVDIAVQAGGGGIYAVCEKGRANNHFSRPAGVLQQPFIYGGHVDRFKNNWRANERMDEVAMTSVGAGKDSSGMRLFLEGLVEEEQHMRTSVAYTLFDDLPLLSWQRDYHLHPARKKRRSRGKRNQRISLTTCSSLGWRSVPPGARRSMGHPAAACSPLTTGNWWSSAAHRRTTPSGAGSGR